MADKVFTIHEPVPTDVVQLIVTYRDGEVVSATAAADLRTTPAGEPVVAAVTKTGAQLPASFRTDMENLLPTIANAIGNENGF